MSVIQTLRGKGSVVVTILLILALVAFIFMDSFQNVGELFRADRMLVADVNGQRMETTKYSQELQEYEQAVKQNQGKENYTPEEEENIRTQFWNQQLNEVLISQESELLGLSVTEKERNSMFTSMNADPVVKQNFTDPKTGIFDPNRVIQYEQQVMQGEDISMKTSWGNFKSQLMKQRKVNKYVAMIKNGIYSPKFMMDEMAKQQFVTASLSYVKIPYDAIDATTIKVTDEEIKNYMSKRKSSFTTQEDNVSMEYVSFPIIPTSGDTANSLGELNRIKEAFAASPDPYDFASDKTDELSDESFYNAKTLKSENSATLIAAPVGSLVGPYYEKGAYRLSKITERKSLPDSVRSSHILIQPSETLTQAQAEASADSILKQVKAGADFAALAKSRSADKESGAKGGDIGYLANGMGFSKEHNEFIFQGSTGASKIVKSQYGYHVVKITDQKAFQPNIKVATIAKLLEASQETLNKAQQKASDFTAKAKDEKSYTATAKKMGMDKRIAQGITGTQGVVQGLGNVRNLVRWAFTAEVGTISNAMMFDDKLVVARVTSKNKKGDMASVAASRPQIEADIRKQKQVEIVKKKVGNPTNLQSVATAYNTEVKTSDSVKMMGMSNPDLGYEAKVLAAAVNKKNVNKVSGPISGQGGVYYIMVKNVSDDVKGAPRIPQMERMQVEGQYKNSAEQLIPVALRKRADINDNRSVSLTY
jgi:peptidyl-prolyl cis-trans isomerase D